MKLWLLLFIRVKTVGNTQHIGPVTYLALSPTQEEALGHGLRFAEEKYPSADGWNTGGTPSAQEVREEVIREAYNALPVCEVSHAA